MPEIIDFGSLKLKFLQSKDDTAGSIDIFEMTVQPNARTPVPHYHDSWDETVYGLNGTSTWRTDQLAYGGVKASGAGREGPRYAIEEMTEQRLVVFNL